jgi:carbon starvation protein CstA
VRYVWVTLVPMVFVAVTTIYAGVLNIMDNFLPLSRVPGKQLLGWVNVTLTSVILCCVVIVLVETGRRAWRVLGKREFTKGGRPVAVKDGNPTEALTFGEA